MEQHILVIGNVTDGLSFHGPFSDVESAQDYAERIRPITEVGASQRRLGTWTMRDQNWHICSLIHLEPKGDSNGQT